MWKKQTEKTILDNGKTYGNFFDHFKNVRTILDKLAKCRD
jgi:hypothetical protein